MDSVVVVVVLAVEDAILLVVAVVCLRHIVLKDFVRHFVLKDFVRLHLGVVLKFVHKDFVRLDQINYQAPIVASSKDSSHYLRIPLRYLQYANDNRQITGSFRHDFKHF